MSSVHTYFVSYRFIIVLEKQHSYCYIYVSIWCVQQLDINTNFSKIIPSLYLIF